MCGFVLTRQTGAVADTAPPPALQPPPAALVAGGDIAFGSYDAPVRSVNLLDRWSGASRAWHASRLKEWQAFQLVDRDHFVLGAVYDTKSLGILQVVVVEKSTRRVRRFEHKVPSPALSVGQGLFETRSVGRWRGMQVTITNDAEHASTTIDAHARATRSRPPMLLHVDAGGTPAEAARIVICHPFVDGTPLYSDKSAVPASGQLTIGERSETFAREATILIVDDHKGRYPAPMAYDWVTGARVTPEGSRIAFNLTHNQVREPEVYNENVVFVDGGTHRLPPVAFERPRDVRGPWHIRDRAGMVDVTFEPEVDNDQHVGPGKVLAEYYGPFGWFSGSVETAQGPVDLDGFYGMGEQKLIRV